jgi:predicted Zn-dependent protease
MYLEENKMTESYFYELVDDVIKKLHKEEVLLCNTRGEDSDFIRFNKGKIRQPGSVSQCYMSLHLIRSQKHIKDFFPLTGAGEEDFSRCIESLAEMRKNIQYLPDDPHLLYSKDPRSSSVPGQNRLPSREIVLSGLLKAGDGVDLIGIYAGGRIYRGFANSFKQKNWFESFSFNFDWSYYHTQDKAVKSHYAGFTWDSDEFRQKANDTREQLSLLAKPAHTIKPGKYNVYLAPSAVMEFVSMACWGGFGLKSRRTKQTPFLRMIEGDETLSSLITVRENTKEGISPNFQSDGFIKPDSVVLIEQGALKDSLVSPRSAKEYGEETNGANGGESPESVDMAGGTLGDKDILSELGTGIYMNNAWYLNYSDMQAARITGMTRFATFWVEGGRIKAPLNVMRFDETLFRMFGSNLAGLTRNRDHILDPSTYEERSTESMRLPGALVHDFSFTL